MGQVFDAECILSKRPRKVRKRRSGLGGRRPVSAAGGSRLSAALCLLSQGKFEYLVKWRGWSSK